MKHKVHFSLNNLRIRIICSFLMFLSSIFLCASGNYHTSTNAYKSACYYADVIKNEPKIDNIGFVVEQKEKEHILPDTATELRALYGAFGNRKSNYAGTVNAEKKRSITFEDYEIKTNLSFVYVQTGVQVSVSKVHKDRFRMEFYPLDLMFKYYPNNPTKFYSFMYLSTDQARSILDFKFPGLFDENIPTSELVQDNNFIEKCQDEILGKGINLNFDGQIKSFEVTNIYYAEDYFYKTVYNTIGDFLVGYNQYPEGFPKEATYFLNEQEYQNNFYLKYIKEAFEPDKYNFGLVNKNYTKEFNKALAFNFLEKNNTFLFVLFLVLSIIWIGGALFLTFRFKLIDITHAISSMLFLIIPYYLAELIYLLSKNMSFFSPFYSIATLVVALVIALFYIGCLVIKKYKNKEAINE